MKANKQKRRGGMRGAQHEMFIEVAGATLVSRLMLYICLNVCINSAGGNFDNGTATPFKAALINI